MAEECKKRVVVRLSSTANPEKFGKKHGMEWIGPVASGLLEGNLQEYEASCETRLRSERQQQQRAAARMEDDDDVEDIIPQEVRARMPRNGGIGVEYRTTVREWHISDNDESSAHVLAAWKRGYLGQGVTVSIVDDGLDREHPDLARAYTASASANFCGVRGTDPKPRMDESHGTAAASIVAATGADPTPGVVVCVHGVAPKAKIAGVRLIAAPVSDADEAGALSTAHDAIDIYSCSWGPPDDGATLDGPGPLCAETMGLVAHDGGKSGKGVVYVWACGNGGTADSCAYDGYASHPDAIAVGALAHDGKQAYYSEACPAVFVCAPSSGAGRSVNAADVAGKRGTSTTDCRSDFGGTSAAAPFVAGVVALMLSANPELDPREVARILAATARRVDKTDKSWTRNAAGMWHSDRYGFGAVDAEAAVLLSMESTECHVDVEWNSEEATKCCASVPCSVSETKTLPCRIPDNAPGTEFETISCIVVDDDTTPETVERAIAYVTVHHQRRGDLRFTLVSPLGTSATFPSRKGDLGTDFFEWPLTSVKQWGEDPRGMWCLHIVDTVAGNWGELKAFSLGLRGHSSC